MKLERILMQMAKQSMKSNIWEIEVRHDGLNKYRIIRGRYKQDVEEKARLQLVIWEEMWQKRIMSEQKVLERDQKAKDKASKVKLAIERTQEALKSIEENENILKFILNKNTIFDWKSLKDNSVYSEKKPNLPQSIEIPKSPVKTQTEYQPRLSILDKIISSRKQEKIIEINIRFRKDYEAWEKEKSNITEKNSEIERHYQESLKQWELNRQEFLDRQQQNNDEIDKRKQEYLNKNTDAIIEYCDFVLSSSEYPEFFPQQFDLDYIPETKILIVEYYLPSIDNIPKLKEVKYVQSRDEFTESYLSASDINKLYDDIIYQITLRTLYELYKSDEANALNSIIFNGWVKSIDKATGKEINPCIVSIQVSHDEFLSINLANVDPKVCFRNLKGIGSSKLHSLTPIAPILNINREDSRFVSSYAVASNIDEFTNLAAMDWEDFEHLIREVFEKEFSETGGEVKITQASKDRGVDAVAFDPDPIRGGKIVIQAKRYTNTVGVSAVRDLYGTVMNEGATKGILVTTSDYGPDAYEFAKGKPLTLLNGSNLLHLLGKHGHKAKIDLKEAKRILSEKDDQ
jgi:restriction system protein